MVSKLKQIGAGLAIVAASWLAAYGVGSVNGFERLEHLTWSWRARTLAEPRVATDEIKLILVDQSSLDWAADTMGLSWPWPREVYAAIIQFCQRGRARALGFDVLFTEPSAYGVEDDLRLADAMASDLPIATAAFLSEGIGQSTQWPADLARSGWPLHAESDVPAAYMVSRATFPVSSIAQAASVVADTRGFPDSDGVLRRARLFSGFDGQLMASLGLATYQASREQPRVAPPEGVQIEADALTIGRRRIPVDSEGCAVLRYRGPSGTYERFTAAQVIQSELRIQQGERPALSPVVFSGRYVLLGFTAPGLLDVRSTPISPVMAGVEVQATLLDNFLMNDFVRPVPTRFFYGALGVWLLVVVGSTLFLRRLWLLLAVSALSLAVPVLIGFGLYRYAIWWPIAEPWAATALALCGVVLFNYATEGRQKAFLKKAFRQYLSPAVIDQLVQHPGQLRLGGERRTLTIFFSDVAGFTSLSEQLEPEPLTALLNDYLSEMSAILLDEGGTLDKYEGDAIMAFWNAPLDQSDHARRALQAVVRCQQKLDACQSRWRQIAGEPLRMRIGVHTGEVIVGNMGSRARFDYSVLGDAANLASRLEGANKVFGTRNLISEATWQAAGGGEAMTGREIGELLVVGRQTPVRVFEVLPSADEQSDTGAPDRSPDLAPGLALCRAQQWAEAGQWFAEHAQDGAAAAYAKRCAEVLTAPESSWDGVWRLESK
jgi:adenylate cyclase